MSEFKIWPLSEAKKHLAELINCSFEQGPQFITKHGKKVAVVISFREFQTLQNTQSKLSEFFANSPISDLNLTRDKSLPR